MNKLIVCVLGLVFGVQADAAPASPASVERLLVVTKTEAVLDAAQANVQQAMRQSMTQARGDRLMTPDEQKAMDATIAKVAALMKDQLSWARMKPEYVRLYVETFDQDEIDGLLAFYQTRAGKGDGEQDADRRTEVGGADADADAEPDAEDHGDHAGAARAEIA